MGVRESLLNTITSVADSDFVRIVTSAGASSKATVRNLFKGFESNLSAKSSLTTSDYIRVVGSDNESYKQSISSMKTAMGIDALNSKTTASSFAVTCNSTYIDTFTNQSSVIGNVAVISMWWKFKSTSQIPATTALFTLPNNATFAQRYYNICYDSNSNVYNILQSNSNTSVVATRDNFTPPSTSAYFYTVMVCVLI